MHVVSNLVREEVLGSLLRRGERDARHGAKERCRAYAVSEVSEALSGALPLRSHDARR